MDGMVKATPEVAAATRKDRVIEGSMTVLAGRLIEMGQPFTAGSEDAVQSAMDLTYEGARKHAHGCVSDSCDRPGFDYAVLALTTLSGSMRVEVLLCELCLSSLEMLNNGSYMLLRRTR